MFVTSVAWLFLDVFASEPIFVLAYSSESQWLAISGGVRK